LTYGVVHTLPHRVGLAIDTPAFAPLNWGVEGSGSHSSFGSNAPSTTHSGGKDVGVGAGAPHTVSPMRRSTSRSIPITSKESSTKGHPDSQQRS
jgi:hypothetical protein